MIGKRFGRLVVIEQAESRGHHKRWKCLCDCGTETVAWQLGLRKGSTRSCGCLKKELTKNRWAEYREPSFWGRVRKGGPKECWPWQAASDAAGYGVLGFEGKHWRAHRLAWTLINGQIPKGLKVCHKCDNPPCCNPKHLFLGTQKDNIDDMIKKGRRIGIQAGENNGRAKLNMEKVREIRALYATGEFSQQFLAGIYGVSQFAISQIVRNKRYVE